jgi:ADP-heptose:LPS heptosyltransferase
MHMAWMQGVPTAVFVGGRPPRNSTPLAPVPSYVLRAQEYVDYTVGYNRQPDEVVSAVPVGEAMEAIEQLLAAGVEDRAERLRRTI